MCINGLLYRSLFISIVTKQGWDNFWVLQFLFNGGFDYKPEKKLNYKVGKFPFAASGKAVASAESDGFVKVITDAQTGEIYGAHIIGSEATELIAEYGLAMELEATVEEVHKTIHAHPTLSEAVMEAAAAATGEAIHI